MTSRITETLRELGPGFAFVGRQVHFDVDGDDYYVDMLFFHMDQNRYVVIELKTGKFQPEFAGKLNFYVALVDDMLRREHHKETIGILICGTKNDRSVRYSLGRSTSPMAVAAYTYDKLPADEKRALPNEGHVVPHWIGPNPTWKQKTDPFSDRAIRRQGHMSCCMLCESRIFGREDYCREHAGAYVPGSVVVCSPAARPLN